MVRGESMGSLLSLLSPRPSLAAPAAPDWRDQLAANVARIRRDLGLADPPLEAIAETTGGVEEEQEEEGGGMREEQGQEEAPHSLLQRGETAYEGDEEPSPDGPAEGKEEAGGLEKDKYTEIMETFLREGDLPGEPADDKEETKEEETGDNEVEDGQEVHSSYTEIRNTSNDETSDEGNAASVADEDNSYVHYERFDTCEEPIENVLKEEKEEQKTPNEKAGPGAEEGQSGKVEAEEPENVTVTPKEDETEEVNCYDTLPQEVEPQEDEAEAATDTKPDEVDKKESDDKKAEIKTKTAGEAEEVEVKQLETEGTKIEESVTEELENGESENDAQSEENSQPDDRKVEIKIKTAGEAEEGEVEPLETEGMKIEESVSEELEYGEAENEAKSKENAQPDDKKVEVKTKTAGEEEEVEVEQLETEGTKIEESVAEELGNGKAENETKSGENEQPDDKKEEIKTKRAGEVEELLMSDSNTHSCVRLSKSSLM